MTDLAFAWTARVLLACCAAAAVRVAVGPRGADRLAGLSVIGALVLALLVMSGIGDGKAFYLDVALVYDVFGFLGILAVARFFREDGEAGR